MHTLSQTRQVFSNADCRATDTCDLKRFTLITSVYEVWFSDDPNYPTYGNGAIIEYETDSVEALVKYVIVQFKKGCVFYSSRNGAGAIERVVGDTVRNFGEHIPFCLPTWVIDSQDTDPAYNSDPDLGRFHLLRWNEPDSYDRRTQKFYGAEKPKKPVVYMADYPSGAFISGSAARNVALEFNTCIYKAADVPAATRRDQVNFAKPIACLPWENVYVYDFDTKTFTTDLAKARREVPSLRPDLYLLAALTVLFIAVALIAVSSTARFLRLRQLGYR
ncbi:MAG TPA: hypothetical protein VNO43_01560 [Candidatus Eisenbacteria bacterium]|nr:hypothetical protein [Candidatus Eisenbacteria bacterium]